MGTVLAIERGMYRNRALLDLAHDCDTCMNCGGMRTEGMDPAHSNLPEHGKAVGGKSHDCFFAALCGLCHRWLDNQAGYGMDPSGRYTASQAGKREMFTKAKDKTLLWIFRNDRLRVT